MDPRQNYKREEPEARSVAQEVTATLWCLALLLAVLLLVYWGFREIYST
ncbi:MAG: hypothetical protein ACRDNR_17330 [Gaiellaceae bacterium]